MPGIITSRTTRSGRRSRASCHASSPSEASITSSFGCSIDRRWRATSSSIVGSSSATSTTAGAAFAFTILMIEELVCFGQVLFRYRSLVQELGGSPRGRLDELLGGRHVLHHGRHVTLGELQLVLHHPLGWIELLADHFLPTRVAR